MGDKVVHVPDDAHAAAKDHCEKTGKRMSEWVSGLILDAVVENKEKPDAIAPRLPIHSSNR